MSDDLWSAFEANARTASDRPAFYFSDRTLTFGEWLDHARRCAAWLCERGIRPNDRVVMWARDPFALAAAVCGTWGAGAVPAMLNLDVPESHRRHSVETIRPAGVLRDSTAHDALEFCGLTIGAFEEIAETPASVVSAIRRLPTDPASIVFTSGSTGRPKAVTQSHGNIIRGCRAVAGYLGLSADDRLLCPVPWSFDYGFVQLHATALLGVAQVLPKIANPFGICDAIAKHRPTVFAGLPSLYTYLLQGMSPLRKTDTSCFRILMNTGGTIPGPVLRQLPEVFPNARIFLNYGLTETYRTSYLPPERFATHSHTIGGPIPGSDIVIVRDDGTLATPGEEGQIVHRGDYVCLGYWNDPEATAKALRPDPLAPAGHPNPPRVMFTGDYGMIDADGYLHFRGRRDHLLKSMGVRVSPSEIEGLIWESGLVKACAVFGCKHDLLGDEVWAAVVPADGVQDVQPRLMTYCRQTMSQYMQPRRYLVKEALPRTTTGKTDYPALREEAARTPSATLVGPA